MTINVPNSLYNYYKSKTPRRTARRFAFIIKLSYYIPSPVKIAPSTKTRPQYSQTIIFL